MRGKPQTWRDVMNVHRRVVLALALMVAVTSTAAAADRLTGMWSAQTRTKGGLGAQWVFSANGEVTMTFGALVDFTYTIAGTRITMTSDKDPASRKDPLVEEFVIAGDTMTQTRVGSADSRKVLQRVAASPAGADPLIGEWTYPHPTGPAAFMRYSREGVVQLSVPLQTSKGTYRLNGNVLEVEVPGRPLTVFDIALEDRALTLTQRGAGKVSRYTRFEY
jgi:hypothetical protein